MTHPAFQVHTGYFLQQGSSGTLRVSDESRYYVVAETWQGTRIVKTEIEKSFPGTTAGKAQAKRLVNELRTQ